jgi:hypothetical protein
LPAATTSLAGVLTGADKTKLDGIATGATANSPDATLLARANHTGTQAASTITGLATVATSGAYSDLSGAPSSLPPSGGAGGVLSGTYPNPGFAVDMATQAELDSGLAGKANTSHTQASSTIDVSATSRILGRVTAGAGAAEELTVAQAKTLLAYTPADIGAATSAQANATHTGDATGATALTLATVNSNVGSFGSATQVATFTVNAKGLTTAAGSITIAIPASQITDFNSASRAQTEAALVAGTNITLDQAQPGHSRLRRRVAVQGLI